MANATLTAIINLQDNMSAGLSRASASLGTLGSKTTGVASTVGSFSTKAGAAMTAVGAAVTAVGMKSVSSFGTFQSNLNQAAVVAGGTSKDIDGLADVANRMGAELPISAEQASQAMIEMARNGASVGEIKEQFPAIAQAATAAGSDLTATAGTVQVAMNIWGDSIKTPEQAAAVLVETANKSNASIEDMQQALATIGPTANQAGVSMQDTSTAIGLLTNKGTSAAEASQQLRHAMLQMQAPSAQAQAKMKELGLSFTDSSGKMKPLKQIIEETAAATDGLSDSEKTAALKTIFHTSGMQAMLPLIDSVKNKNGDAKVSWDAMSKSINNASSSQKTASKYLADSANEMQQNVGSKLEQVGGNFEALSNKAMAAKDGLISSMLDMVNKTLEWATNSNSSIAEVVRGFLGLAPVIGPALSTVGMSMMALSPIIKLIGSGITGLGNLAKLASTGIAGLKDGFTGLTNGAGLAGNAVKLLGSAFTFLTTPVGAVIAGITAVIGVVIYLYNTNEGVRTAIQTAWTAIQQTFTTVVNAISTILNAVFSPLLDMLGIKNISFSQIIQTVWNTIKTTIALSVQNIATVVTAAFNIIQTVIQTVSTVIANIVTVAWSAIKTAITVTMTVIKTVISAIMAAIQGDWSGAWNIIKSGASTVWNAIKNFVNTGINAVKNIITSVMNGIKSLWSTIWNAIKSVASNILNAIKSTISNGMNGAKSTISSVLNGIKSTWSNIWNGIKSTTSNIMNNLKSAAQNGVNNIKNTFNTLSSLGQQMVNIGKNIVQGLINGVGSMAGALMQAAKNVAKNCLNSIKSALGIHSPSRVMRDQVGKFIPLGMAVGMEREEGSLTKQAERLTEAATPSVPALDLNAGGLKAFNKQASKDLTSNMSAEVATSAQPANITLQMGKQSYKAFVDDITSAQNKATRMELSYGV